MRSPNVAPNEQSPNQQALTSKFHQVNNVQPNVQNNVQNHIQGVSNVNNVNVNMQNNAGQPKVIVQYGNKMPGPNIQPQVRK